MKKYTFAVMIVLFALMMTSCFDSTSSDPKLNQPTDFTVTQQSQTEFLLEWTDNSKKEEGYKIERKFDEEEWQEIAELSENAENFLDDISAAKDDWELISYRVYSYESNDVSLPAEGYYVLNLPAPTNLTAEYTTQILPGLPECVWGLRRTYGCDDNDLDFEQWQFESRYAIFTPYVEDLTTDVTGINKYIVKP